MEALVAGYSVRAAVRSKSGADTILSTPTIKRLYPDSDQLSFVYVTDITAEGAYDEAVKGVKYIIHIASPFPGPNVIDPKSFEAKVIGPAVKGTVGILNSAAKANGIKRIVITSSNLGVVPFAEIAGPDSGETFNGNHRVPANNGPYAFAFQAYCASKTKALIATDDFFAIHKPDFDHVNIMPCHVLGKSELATTVDDILSSSNGPILRAILGEDGFLPLPGTTVYLDDIAKIHVLALNTEKIPGSQNFIASSGGVDGIQFNEYQEIVKQYFPEEVANGILANNGNQPTKSLRIDASNTEMTFGIKFQEYEKQVLSIVENYLDIIRKVL